jgi:hypothetical protein
MIQQYKKLNLICSLNIVMVLIVVLVAAGILGLCYSEKQPVLSPVEISVLSSSISSDIIDAAIEFHGGHHAEFYQDDTGACAWFIVDDKGAVLSRLEVSK